MQSNLLLDLPPELRHNVYKFYFIERTFVNTEFVAVSWLHDIFLVCRAVSQDPWLTEAVVKYSTFHITSKRSLECLEKRFGKDTFQRMASVRIGSSLSDDCNWRLFQVMVPGLRQVRILGYLWPMDHLWDRNLDGFHRNHASKIVADQCVFGRYGVLTAGGALIKAHVLDQGVDLVVDFVWNDPDYGKRKMTFSLHDWSLSYSHRGETYQIPQTRYLER